MVAVGGIGVLVEVAVACGAAIVDVRVGGEGWLPQDARKRNTTNIRTRVTGFVKSIDAVLAYGGRLLWFFGLDLLGFILFNKIHLANQYLRKMPKKWVKARFALAIISKLYPFLVVELQVPG
jgi:hypothetical protein